MDLPDHTQLTGRALHEALYGALRSNISSLPQLKGKGREHDPGKVDQAVGAMVDKMMETLRISGIVVLRKAPGPRHSA